MIWRDDDIGLETEQHYKGRLDRFILVHELFKKYKVNHHIAVIAEDIEKATKLVKYINSNPLIKVEVHCWRHIHYINENPTLFMVHLQFAIEKIKEVFSQKPQYFFPPWNELNDYMKYAAHRAGLIPSNEKISLQQYLSGVTEPEIINFHFWADPLEIIEQALIKYTT